jgi:hypothetical protein
MTLSAEYLLSAERRARRFAGQYTGTSGTLAADVLRLLRELETMQSETFIADAHAELHGEPPRRPMRLPGDGLLSAGDREPSAAEQLLLDAAAAVRDRHGRYGPPDEHFARTAAMVNAAFGTSFTAADWADVMILDKVARSRGPMDSRDNDVDKAGYAGCRDAVRGHNP